MDTSATKIFDDIAFLKVLCIALIPVFLIAVTTILYRLIFIHNTDKFKRYCCVTTITIIFLLHPSLTQYCLRIFKCVEIGEGNNKVEMDITTDCWSANHLKWVFTLALPMLIFYVFGCPMMALAILYKNRNRLDQPEVLQYIILLYQGLKHESYYWELVNTFRKVLLLAFHVFIPDKLRIMKALLGVFLLFMISILQARLKPFKIGIISTLEHREMISSLLTLYGGLIFVQEYKYLPGLSIAFFVLIVLANIRFMVLWVFCATTVYKKYKYIDMINRWIKKSFCLKIPKLDEDYLSYKSRVTTKSDGKKSKESKMNITTDMKNRKTTNLGILKQFHESQATSNRKGLTNELNEISQRAEGSTLRSIYTPKKLLNPKEEGISRRKRIKKGTKKLLKGGKKVKRMVFDKQTDKVALENDSPPDVVEFFGQAFRPSEIDRRMGSVNLNKKRPTNQKHNYSVFLVEDSENGKKEESKMGVDASRVVENHLDLSSMESSRAKNNIEFSNSP